MIVFINIERILRCSLNFEKLSPSQCYNSRRYYKEQIIEVLTLLDKGLKIRDIVKQTGIPETTIRNWRFGYSNLYWKNKNLDDRLKKEIIDLLSRKMSIPEIAKILQVNYNTVRLFVKTQLSEKEYNLIKVISKSLPDKSKELTPELAYILGVMYGDGYFGKCQIRLGTKDRDFADYFNYVSQKWSGKKPAIWERIKNNKPYYECYLSFKDATDFVKSIVQDRKKIPEIITYSNNKKIIMMFIKGFSDSEGSIIINNRSRTYKVYNQNKQVLEDIKRMMLKLGFDEKKLYIVKNNNAKNGIVYALRISFKDQIRLFYKTIGFTINRKQQKLESLFNEELSKEDMAAVV